MIYIVIVNFIGIIGCMIGSRVLTYLFAYISAIAFFHVYEKIAWKILYESVGITAAIEEVVDTKLMSIVATIICITGIFFFCVFTLWQFMSGAIYFTVYDFSGNQFI